MVMYNGTNNTCTGIAYAVLMVISMCDSENSIFKRVHSKIRTYAGA